METRMMLTIGIYDYLLPETFDSKNLGEVIALLYSTQKLDRDYNANGYKFTPRGLVEFSISTINADAIVAPTVKPEVREPAPVEIQPEPAPVGIPVGDEAA